MRDRGEIRVKKPRYVRVTESGLYWEPSRLVRKLGFAPEALGTDEVVAITRARELNAQVKEEKARQARGEPPRLVEGSVSWWVAEYRRSENWNELAESTRAGYAWSLKRIEAWAGPEQISGVTRKAAIIWYRETAKKTPAYAAQNARVLRILLNFAKDEGHQVADLSKMRLHTAGGGSEPWEAWEISAYVDQAKRMGRQSMALALMLGVALGQREGDVIRLPRSAHDTAAGNMVLQQNKTKKKLAVPVLPELAREIAVTPARGTIFVISEPTGTPYKRRYFARIHREICRAAGIADERCFMHLRHTAATRLGEAGCSDELIQAVTGHKTRQTLGRYVKPTDVMSRAAIAKLQDHRGKGK